LSKRSERALKALFKEPGLDPQAKPEPIPAREVTRTSKGIKVVKARPKL
jgi:hypothetical protein